MNHYRYFLVSILFLAMAAPALAQEVKLELPEVTHEQRWQRSSRLLWVNFAVMIAHAKSKGQSVDEFGRYLGSIYAPSWSRDAAGQPMRVFRGVYRNWMILPDLKVEIIAATESSVKARFSRPYVSYFNDDGKLYDCTIEEWERVLELSYQGIASYLDLQYNQRREGDWLVVTLQKKATSKK